MTHDCSFLTDLHLAGDVSTGPSDRRNHAGDYGTPDDEQVRPDAVVWPASTADVSAVLAAANDRGVPVTPYAAGTGLEGNATPVRGGVSLDLTRMDAVLDVRPDDMQIDVQAGVYGGDVDEAVGKDGLFFPPLPSSGDISTVGGMVATGASGMKTVKYGVVGDWVLELEAVLADGSVITAGSKAVKTSAGYDLKSLLVGSEGTLAVVTRATLRLAGIPRQVRGVRATFGTLSDAADAISDAVTAGVDLAKIELVDEVTARVADAYADADLPERPMVFVEFHADHGVDEEVAFCRSVFASHDVETFETSGDGPEMAALWEARRDLAFAQEEYDPDLTPTHAGDVTVPISDYPDVVRRVQSLAAEYDLLVSTFGHAGDGNVHWAALVDENDPEQVAAVEDLYRRVVEFALDRGGTSTGEHGVGTGKREYMVPEHGEATVAAMRSIKRALDPQGTLNPGKIFPPDAPGDGSSEPDPSP